MMLKGLVEMKVGELAESTGRVQAMVGERRGPLAHPEDFQSGSRDYPTSKCDGATHQANAGGRFYAPRLLTSFGYWRRGQSRQAAGVSRGQDRDIDDQIERLRQPSMNAVMSP